MKKHTLFIVCLLVPLIAAVTACSSSPSDFDVNSTVSKMSNSFLTINEIDKPFAAEIEAVQNQKRGNASGPKITSGSYSDEFPGICFIWDSKAENSGYLKVDMSVYSAYDNFFITTKESSAYWDFFITVAEGQQATEDGCYIFFLPHASGNKNINMVFISEYTKHETETEKPAAGTGTDKPPAPPTPGSAVKPPAPPTPGPSVNPPAPPLPGLSVKPPAPPTPGPSVKPPAPPTPDPSAKPPAPPTPGPGVKPPSPPLPGPAVKPPAPPPGPGGNPPPPPETEEPSEEVEVCY